MTSESKAGSEKPARSIELIVRDLRGLLTPLDRQFDEIDRIILGQLLDELDAKRERDKELAKHMIDYRNKKLDTAKRAQKKGMKSSAHDERCRAEGANWCLAEIAALNGEGQAGERQPHE